MILIVEALSDGFVAKFWSFIKEAGYGHIQRGSQTTEFYRFRKPQDDTCPSQIELFSRIPDFIKAPNDIHIVPIPTGEDLSSLSAILMNDEYYNYTIDNSNIVQGMHIARSNALICLKASAYLDLQKRQDQGEKVDSDDIVKHRNDIIRLGLTLTAEQSFIVPEEIQAELHRFFDAIKNNLPQDDFIERAGARGIKVADVVERIKKAFNV